MPQLAHRQNYRILSSRERVNTPWRRSLRAMMYGKEPKTDELVFFRGGKWSRNN